MHAGTTPRLSREGVDEIVAEMTAPPVDSPERRATFARARAAGSLVRQMIGSALADVRRSPR
jgi:hypothetical protein